MPPSVLYGLADLLRQRWRCLHSGAVFRAVAGQSDGTLESVGFLVRDIYVPTWGLLPSAHGPPMASPPTENSPRSLCLGTPPGFPGPLCVRRGCSSSTSHLSPTAHCSFISQTWTLRSSRAHVAVGAWLSPLSPETVKAAAWDLCPAFGGTQSPKWSLMSCWRCWMSECTQQLPTHGPWWILMRRLDPSGHWNLLGWTSGQSTLESSEFEYWWPLLEGSSVSSYFTVAGCPLPPWWGHGAGKCGPPALGWLRGGRESSLAGQMVPGNFPAPARLLLFAPEFYFN